MIYDDLENFLTGQGLLTGWQLYVDGFRDRGDKAINIQEYGNDNGDNPIEANTRQIQIMVRGFDTTEVYAHAAEICKSLSGEEGDRIVLSSTRWAIFYIRNTPFKFREDEHGRIYYVFNVACTTFKY